ncbi:MAG: hypothetical protein ICV86_01785 [Microcoleus sp. T3-bin5]|nr:hypothetical protein [Microcoleus sp. T3-bin5]
MPKPKRSWRYLQSDLPDCLRFARSPHSDSSIYTASGLTHCHLRICDELEIGEFGDREKNALLQSFLRILIKKCVRKSSIAFGCKVL